MYQQHNESLLTLGVVLMLLLALLVVLWIFLPGYIEDLKETGRTRFIRVLDCTDPDNAGCPAPTPAGD